MVLMDAGGAHDLAVPPLPALDQDSDLLVPEFVSTLCRIAAVTSIGTTLAGVLVLLGWVLDVETLKRLIPGLTAMNPTTAVGFVCGGCALGLLATQSHLTLARRLALALAAVTALLGAARVLALAGIHDLGVDRLLFADKLLAADFGRPNQMAPNTAVNFLLLGAALLIIDRPLRRFRWAAQLLSLTAAMTSLLALMGYAYGLRSF
jgi:methyl-accepting chemotaxis protein